MYLRSYPNQKHKKTAAVTSQWGTYGIIGEAEYVLKALCLYNLAEETFLACTRAMPS